ncbi:MAG: hypothetical protein HQM10_12190 [Candidatus Riflebacteria bacterium]|nr:hypothetical protein [Candidatus Riflebacteria bacterium]
MYRFILDRVLLVCIAATVFSGNNSSVCAQDSRELKFNLKNEPVISGESSFKEFKVSLDSRFLNFDSSEKALNSDVTEDGERILNTSSVWEENSLGRSGNLTNSGEEKNRRTAKRSFSSKLTLTAGYVEEPKAWGAPRSSTFSAEANGSRWSVSGKVGREDPFLVPVLTSVNDSNSSSIKKMANMADSNTTEKSDGPASSESKGMPQVLNNYYLEAIYKFLPSVKGKVSYERSQYDSLERNEKLQVEGLVDAGRNMMIKAGYRNQRVPEISDKSDQQDTKVWTEFILKF